MAEWAWKNDEASMVEQDVEMNKMPSKLERTNRAVRRGQDMVCEGRTYEYGFHLILQPKVDLYFSLYIFLYYM